MSEATQTERLLDLLREVGEAGVTPLLALERIGSFRLGARIWDLRKQGYWIESDRVKTPGGASVACYVLRENRIAAFQPDPDAEFRLTARGKAKTETPPAPAPIEPNGQARLW